MGARCSDGVVLVADRKVTIMDAGLHHDFVDKLFGVVRHVIFGSSGNTGMFELFRRYATERIRDNIVLIDDIPLRLSEITFELNSRFNFRYETTFDVLVGIQYPDRASSLTYISPRGETNTISQYMCIGSGAPP
jgi:20S proteasome alpha/beta subunit